jgi:hypothetical protein
LLVKTAYFLAEKYVFTGEIMIQQLLFPMKNVAGTGI